MKQTLMKPKQTRGKLIVIDGADGSGKATQTRLLVQNLKKSGFRVRVEAFPQYGKKSAALVEEYLSGNLGTAKELGPYIPSLFYALDRFAASKRIKQYLSKGYVVICDRYTTANLAHQGGKIRAPAERAKYFRWLANLEYKLLKIPKPDLTLILHVPAHVAQQLAGKGDLHEKDLPHLRATVKTYIEISRKFRYPIVECYRNGKMLSRQEIAKKIWQIMKSKLKA